VPDEEVKIHIRTDADTQALAATQAKIKELYQTAAAYESKGMDTAAKSVRAEAATYEKDVARFKREQHAAEKDITRERREQAAITRAEETQQQTTGRMLFGGRRRMQGGLVGGAAVLGIGEAFTEYTERQGIELRAAAQRKLDERGLAIAGSWRGSSSKTLAQEQGLDDDIARQVANRPELERKARAGIFDRALSYGAAGAGTGFALSGGNPIGAGLGFIAGAAKGAWKSYEEGAREKDEDTKTLEAKRKKREELEALGKRQVREEDGQIEMDIASHRAERTMSGSRAVVVDEAKKKYLNRYRELMGMHLSDEEADKTAGLEAETSMRDRQQAAGAGLVNAHSGAGDIAAAARWAAQTTPDMAAVISELKGIHGTAKKNSEAAERIDRSMK
jgi:hypothetical protein